MIIGIDNGNSDLKTRNHVFTAGLSSHDYKPAMAEDVLFFRDKYYTLSSERIPYTRDKTKDDQCFILTLFGIAKEILSREAHSFENVVDLGVGLPPEHYPTLMERFGKYFKKYGEHLEFEYRGKTFKIHMRSVHVFPQCYAAAVFRSKEIARYSRIYIIDIGGYTLDYLLLSDGKPDLSQCRSLDLGVINLYNEIKKRVNTSFEMRIEDSHIIDVVQGKETVLPTDVLSAIREEVKRYSEKVLNQIRENKIDLRANPAIFVSGGSLLIQEYLQKAGLAKIDFIEDVSANAKGYEVFIESLLKQGADKS